MLLEYLFQYAIRYLQRRVNQGTIKAYSKCINTASYKNKRPKISKPNEYMHTKKKKGQFNIDKFIYFCKGD